jgi:hypothetical protein
MAVFLHILRVAGGRIASVSYGSARGVDIRTDWSLYSTATSLSLVTLALRWLLKRWRYINQWILIKVQQHWYTHEVKMRQLNLLLLRFTFQKIQTIASSSDKYELPQQWKQSVILPTIRTAIKLTDIETYDCYQLQEQFYPTFFYPGWLRM